MKVVVIGATGTIGHAVVTALEPRHEVVIVGHSQSELRVDITQPSSIEALYLKLGNIDAVVVATGRVGFAELTKMDHNLYMRGLQNKLMGQINLVLMGINNINNGGSFTLTSGILNRDPIARGSLAATVNGGIDAFVKAAAIELPRGIRINSVSPTVLEESMESFAPYFRGYKPTTAANAALAYSKSVEGLQTGQVYIVG